MAKLSTKSIYVDENSASLVAYQVILITVFALYFQFQWLLLLLSLDFFARATGLFFSPVYFSARKLTAFLHFDKKMVFAGPKRFAAMLGFVMSLLITFFYNSDIGVFLGLTLIFLAALDSVFSFCIGCYIYNFIVLPIQNKFNNSPK